MIGAIVQARMGSTRLPGKTMMDLDGMSTLARVVTRLEKSKYIDKVIVATTTNEEDDVILEETKRLGCLCYRGKSEDVLDRVTRAALTKDATTIVEITADCPLIHHSVVDPVIEAFKEYRPDIATNFIPQTYPKGYEVRVFGITRLKRLNEIVDNPVDRQHVSTALFWNPQTKGNYTVHNVEAPPESTRPELAVTLDTPEDLEMIRKVFAIARETNLDLTPENVCMLFNLYPFLYNDVAKVVRKDYLTELKEYWASPEYKRKERARNAPKDSPRKVRARKK